VHFCASLVARLSSGFRGQGRNCVRMSGEQGAGSAVRLDHSTLRAPCSGPIYSSVQYYVIEEWVAGFKRAFLAASNRDSYLKLALTWMSEAVRRRESNGCEVLPKCIFFSQLLEVMLAPLAVQQREQ
jgi:hypothetical protein